MNISQILPIKVYNKSHYSLITETYFDNEFSFFTEKTVKPLLALRLFVVISGYKFLYNLRKLGFKTFHGIIDESYDLVEDNEERWNLAFKQIEYLCRQDSEVIIKQALPVLLHNHRLAMTYNSNEIIKNAVEDYCLGVNNE